jgi:agmatine deiminase
MVDLKREDYYMPAEWEKHYGTWLTYPHNEETFFERLESAKNIFSKLVKLISESEVVHINVNNEDEENELKEKLKNLNANFENIKIHKIKTNDSWCRDYSGIFLKNRRTGEIVITDWKFNSWGGKYPFELDNQLPEKQEKILNLKRIKIDMVLEGGSIDVNGKGLLITTESCLLNKNRNPDLSKEEIEEILKNVFGVRKILWLKEGIVGDDTDGHIDDITRFVNENTIITAVETNKEDENYEILMENYKKLKTFTDLKGSPLNIITIPMPPPIYYKFPWDKEPSRLPASYANFYITNKYVIVPIFNAPTDNEAINKLQNIFKNRKVIGIDATDIILGLGAFHCLTQQIPE